jgi:hypothetical protein
MSSKDIINEGLLMELTGSEIFFTRPLYTSKELKRINETSKRIETRKNTDNYFRLHNFEVLKNLIISKEQNYKTVSNYELENVLFY